MGAVGASLRLLVSGRLSAHSRQSERDAANELQLEDELFRARVEGGRRDGGGRNAAADDQTAERLWLIAMDAG
jgi:stalled ribosome alternative rescue factor ArfA